MTILKLSAHIRKAKGKEAAKKLRREQQVPAVFYGPGRETVMLAVHDLDFQGLLRQSAIENAILGLEIETDSGKETRNVMIKEMQMDPIKNLCRHVDFYEISMDKAITIDVPIHLINAPIGVTKGGILQHGRRELTISALPGKLVEFLEMDVSGLDIGQTLHVRDIKLPEGVTTSLDDDQVVAHIAAPAVATEKEEGATEEQTEDMDTQSEQKE